MKKVQFCCGANHLNGWENFDANINIKNLLPFENDSVDFIFIEHGIEHVTQMEGLSFLMQCRNILKPGGIIRVTFPDVEKILNSPECIKEYSKRWGWQTYHKDKTVNVLRVCVFSWNHKSMWTAGIIKAAMRAADLKSYEVQNGKSEHPELQNIEQHWRMTFSAGGCTADEAKRIEALHTSTVEGKRT